MSIQALNAAANPVVNTPGSLRNTLDQSDFIRLLTTQMANQDPTDPVDNKDTIAQMAQFSSLAGLDQVNQTLQAIQTQLAEVLAEQASANNPTPTT
jgi:flagellar basal-body rod modification protein FlgD